MARYRVLGWKGIPSMVEAADPGETVRRTLSPRFQELIDAVAMREGASDGEAYLEGWAHGPEAERPGRAREVAEQIAAELEAGFPALARRRMDGPPRSLAPPDPEGGR